MLAASPLDDAMPPLSIFVSISLARAFPVAYIDGLKPHPAVNNNIDMGIISANAREHKLVRTNEHKFVIANVSTFIRTDVLVLTIAMS